MTRKFKWFLRLLFIVSFIFSFSICTNVHAETRARSHKKKYTVTFVDGVTGKTIKTKRVSYGKSVTPPKPKKHKGYRFKKWKGNTKKIRKDTVVKARYVRVYTVKFKIDGKTVKKELVEKGKNAHPPVFPKDKMRKYTGWDKSYKKIRKNKTIEAEYYYWPDWTDNREIFGYLYGGLDGINSTFSGKRLSMQPVENHSLGKTNIYTILGRQVFADFWRELNAGNEELGFEWVCRKAKELAHDDFSELTNSIEQEFFGFTCPQVYYKYGHSLNYTLAEYKENLKCKAKIDAIAKDIVGSGMTEREASAKFLEYITKKLSYSNAFHSRDSRAWLALCNGCGNCQAYSKIYKEMCNAVGIDCELVSGITTQEGKTSGHMWNRVNIDGKWYYMDVTWADDNGWFDNTYTYSQTLWGTHKVCSIPHCTLI